MISCSDFKGALSQNFPLTPCQTNEIPTNKFQSRGSPYFGNFNLGVSGQTFWVQGLWIGTKNILKGKMVAPQVQAVVNLVNLCLPMAHPCIKNAPTMH